MVGRIFVCIQNVLSLSADLFSLARLWLYQENFEICF